MQRQPPPTGSCCCAYGRALSEIVATVPSRLHPQTVVTVHLVGSKQIHFVRAADPYPEFAPGSGSPPQYLLSMRTESASEHAVASMHIMASTPPRRRGSCEGAGGR